MLHFEERKDEERRDEEDDEDDPGVTVSSPKDAPSRDGLGVTVPSE